MNQDGAAKSSSACRSAGTGRRAIIVDYDHADVHAFGPSLVHGQTKVQTVARVILNDEQSATWKKNKQIVGLGVVKGVVATPIVNSYRNCFVRWL